MSLSMKTARWEGNSGRMFYFPVECLCGNFAVSKHELSWWIMINSLFTISRNSLHVNFVCDWWSFKNSSYTTAHIDKIIFNAKVSYWLGHSLSLPMTTSIDIVKRRHVTSVLTSLSKMLSGDLENVMTPSNHHVAANLFLTSHEGLISQYLTIFPAFFF